MAHRRRIGKGGIAFTYTPEEERQMKEKRAFKEILPLIASVLLEMHEDVKEDESAEPVLKSSRKSKPKASQEKIVRLRRLMEVIGKQND